MSMFADNSRVRQHPPLPFFLSSESMEQQHTRGRPHGKLVIKTAAVSIGGGAKDSSTSTNNETSQHTTRHCRFGRRSWNVCRGRDDGVSRVISHYEPLSRDSTPRRMSSSSTGMPAGRKMTIMKMHHASPPKLIRLSRKYHCSAL